MEAFKQLVSSRDEKHLSSSPHKQDKLLQTKLREKEIKAALKEKKEGEKKEKEEVRLATANAMRFERALYHDSKRFAKDERAKHKKEEHRESGSECEHGVWRCRICNPVTKHK
jgi:FKBP-type peptidyl-prolyl cis-trans isomerase